MMGEDLCRRSGCQSCICVLQWKLSSCCSCVVWFMNYEIVSEEFELKEGLNKGNKSFEKTMKLCAVRY